MSSARSVVTDAEQDKEQRLNGCVASARQERDGLCLSRLSRPQRASQQRGAAARSRHAFSPAERVDLSCLACCPCRYGHIQAMARKVRLVEPERQPADHSSAAASSPSLAPFDTGTPNDTVLSSQWSLLLSRAAVLQMKEGVDSVNGVQGSLFQVAETLPDEARRGGSSFPLITYFRLRTSADAPPAGPIRSERASPRSTVVVRVRRSWRRCTRRKRPRTCPPSRSQTYPRRTGSCSASAPGALAEPAIAGELAAWR